MTPIFKKGDRKFLSNYRPIANLPILSKIIEKLIHKRFNNFFSKFNTINPNQFGFQPGKSTEQAIIRLLDSLYDCINQNKFAIAVFVDYKKAFDTINHEILIKKLELLGIRGRALNFVKSFLFNRLYKFRINSSTSDELVCNIG